MVEIPAVGPSHFTKQRIADEQYEAVGVFDVDGDGHLDIVSGAWWYAGPDFNARFPVCDVAFDGSYHDDFSTISLDVDGDGLMDVITGGWAGETLRWRRNPGQRGMRWKEQVIAHVGPIETTRAWDVDGDGQLEIVPNTPNGPLRSFKLVAPGRFEERVHREGPSGHGLGFGDVYGTGRGMFVLSDGVVDPHTGEFVERVPFSAHFEHGAASVPMLVEDIDGDGRAEVIVGSAHGYGLDWWKREADVWVRRSIDPFNSQYHDLAWADLDGDGRGELISGKRYRAHDDDDPGAHDPFGLYYFKWTGENFVKHVIDYGQDALGQGTGIQFAIADLDGNGFPDIVAAGKDGLTLYRNMGYYSAALRE